MSVLTSGQNWQYSLGTLCVEIVFCLALILTVRALFGHLIGPVGRRLLWCVLIVRCLVPVSIPSTHHPVTHLIKAYEQRQEGRVVSPKPPQVASNDIPSQQVGNRSPSGCIVEHDDQKHNEHDLRNSSSALPTRPLGDRSATLGTSQPSALLETPLEVETEPATVDDVPQEIRAATVTERSPHIENIAAIEPVVTSQKRGGFGETALPDDATQVVAATKRLNVGVIVFGVWATGFAVFLTMAVACNRRMVRAACRSPESVPDWMQAMFLECRTQLKIRTWPVLIVSRNVKTPCLVGAIRPRVLVPMQLLDDSSQPPRLGVKSIDTVTAMRYIFLHELTHLKQGDIWLSWCWTLVMALHWYNPLLWWVGRLVGFDCEAACDFRVLERLEPGRHASYGRSLLEILQKLNSPVVRSPGFSAVIEGKTNFERRLVMITNYRKRTFLQTLTGGVLLALLLAASLTTFAREKHEPISADKAKMIGYVEDYFLRNYRDITMRKSLEWGDVVTDEQGNSTIRYKFEALLWDKDRMIHCADFTFDKDGRYVSVKTLDGFPHPKEKPESPNAIATQPPVAENKEDRETLERLLEIQEALYQAKRQLLAHDKEVSDFDQIIDRERKELNQKLESMEDSERIKAMVEDFARRRLESGIEYSQKRKEIVQNLQEIENELEHYKAVAQLKRDFGPDSQRQNVQPQLPAAERQKATDADKEKAARDFLNFLYTGKCDEAAKMMTPLMQDAMPTEELQQLFEGMQKTMGKIEWSGAVRVADEQGFRVTYEGVALEKMYLTLKVVVDDDAKIAGFFVVGVLPRFGKTDADEEKAVSGGVSANDNSNDVDTAQYVWDKFGIRGQPLSQEESEKFAADSQSLPYGFKSAIRITEVKPDGPFGKMQMQKDDLLAGFMVGEGAWNTKQLADLRLMGVPWTSEQMRVDEVKVLVMRNGEMFVGNVLVK